MNTVQEIERAIGELTPRELEELYAWLDQHCPQPIDAQLKADLDAGRMDDRIDRALADHQAGNCPALQTRNFLFFSKLLGPVILSEAKNLLFIRA